MQETEHRAVEGDEEMSDSRMGRKQIQRKRKRKKQRALCEKEEFDKTDKTLRVKLSYI